MLRRTVWGINIVELFMETYNWLVTYQLITNRKHWLLNFIKIAYTKFGNLSILRICRTTLLWYLILLQIADMDAAGGVIERDDLNLHPCMVTFCTSIRHILESNIRESHQVRILSVQVSRLCMAGVKCCDMFKLMIAFYTTSGSIKRTVN